MTFELLPMKDFYRHFGDGYCVEISTNPNHFDRLLAFLCEHSAQWRFYTTLSNGYWFHGMHIVFPKGKDMDSIMRHVCELSEINSYCIVEGGTQTVVDTNGDILSSIVFTTDYYSIFYR